MVHTRNGSNSSVQPDGCGKGRGKTKPRSVKSSSMKTYMEDSRVAPHFPRSVPTDFDVNSEPKLIHDNISRAEPFLSGRNRNISMPVQKLVHSSQRRGVGNMPKPLAEGHELLLTHQELSGSGEDYRTLRRLEPIVLQRQGQKMKNWLKNQSLLSIDQKKELEMTQLWRQKAQWHLTAPNQLQKCPKRTSEETERSQEPSKQGKRQSQLAQTFPQGYRLPKLEPSAMDSVFNMARTLMEFTAKEKGRMNRTFPRKEYNKYIL
ncbi:hypothetical protein O181_110112 [Austropuccinia psidii MF-1]|uniref:Uncharacterized protein n=1 Tax=Austropuccinia psidii MF-1 TaxID=1389203 RepID=A0A9Q3PS17_9BASI|nr:hypothetical protein [Austropuccinia psidii MF-1]